MCCHEKLPHIPGREIDALGERITVYPQDEDGELCGTVRNPKESAFDVVEFWKRNNKGRVVSK